MNGGFSGICVIDPSAHEGSRHSLERRTATSFKTAKHAYARVHVLRGLLGGGVKHLTSNPRCVFGERVLSPDHTLT